MELHFSEKIFIRAIEAPPCSPIKESNEEAFPGTTPMFLDYEAISSEDTGFFEQLRNLLARMVGSKVPADVDSHS